MLCPSDGDRDVTSRWSSGKPLARAFANLRAVGARGQNAGNSLPSLKIAHAALAGRPWPVFRIEGEVPSENMLMLKYTNFHL
jgi:hypothetical protein